MKLFDEFEALKFQEENLILITQRSYIYYIYNIEHDFWRKYRNAGNDSITVANYPDVSRLELEKAMGGVFPTKETDFLRLCNPSQLRIGDMLALLRNDYSDFMEDYDTYRTTYRFLLESDICFKSYEKLKELFDEAVAIKSDNEEIIRQIKTLSLDVIGRDIYKPEIGIVDGHDSSSYFWIMPARVVDSKDTNDLDSVAEMRSIEISIEEDDVAQYLTPFLYEYFDDQLEANKNRIEYAWEDDGGNRQVSRIEGFEWYLTHNFYTFDAVNHILQDIRETVDALSQGRETEYTRKLKIKRGMATNTLLYAKGLSEKEIQEYNDNRPTEDNTAIELLIDFYKRFEYRMEYMMRVGAEKGYNLISFMGP